MKKFLLYALVIIIFISRVKAQEVLVPIREQNKFGLSTLNKNLKVKPIYDKIDFGIRPKYFVGFKKKKNNLFVTTLLNNEKVIIEDQPYFDYGIYDNLIVAIDTTSNKTGKSYNLFYNEKSHLYTKDGKLLTPNYNALVSIYEDASKIKPTTDLIVLFKDFNDKFSLKIYDTKEKHFTKTLLDNVDNLDFLNNDQMFWALESLKLTYTKADVYGRMEIKLIDGSFEILSDIKKVISQKPKKRDYNYDDVEVPEGFDRSKRKIKGPESDSILKTLTEVNIIKNHKNFLETNFLYFEENWYGKKDYSLGFKSGKVGLIDKKQGKYILPAEYDEIYKVSYFAAFVIKKNDKYGLFFSFTNEIIEPIFDDFPVVVRKKHKNLGYDLVALFDTETKKLKYYASFNGVIFVLE
jgi:hypothetical protein